MSLWPAPRSSWCFHCSFWFHSKTRVHLTFCIGLPQWLVARWGAGSNNSARCPFHCEWALRVPWCSGKVKQSSFYFHLPDSHYVSNFRHVPLSQALCRWGNPGPVLFSLQLILLFVWSSSPTSNRFFSFFFPPTECVESKLSVDPPQPVKPAVCPEKGIDLSILPHRPFSFLRLSLIYFIRTQTFRNYCGWGSEASEMCVWSRRGRFVADNWWSCLWRMFLASLRPSLLSFLFIGFSHSSSYIFTTRSQFGGNTIQEAPWYAPVPELTPPISFLNFMGTGRDKMRSDFALGKSLIARRNFSLKREERVEFRPWGEK